MDADLERIDFPLGIGPMEPECVSKLLSEELLNKIELNDLEKTIRVLDLIDQKPNSKVHANERADFDDADQLGETVETM